VHTRCKSTLLFFGNTYLQGLENKYPILPQQTKSTFIIFTFSSFHSVIRSITVVEVLFICHGMPQKLLKGVSVLISYLLFFDHRIPNQCFSVCCLFVHIYGCNLRILICSVIVNSPIHVTTRRIYGYLIFSFA